MFNLRNGLIKPAKKVYYHMAQIASDADTRMKPFAIYCIIGYPLYYLINIYILGNVTYESIIPRLIIGILALLILLKDRWPKRWRFLLPACWYVFLLYSLPFFLTFMTLKNHGSTGWVLNLLAITMLLALLTDWISYIFLLVSGLLLASVVYYLTTPGPFVYIPGNLRLEDIFSTFAASLIMIIVLSHKREKMEEEKLHTILAVATSIAHELRTPLASIEVGGGALDETLPPLIDGYNAALTNRLIDYSLVPSQLEGLLRIPKNIQSEINSALLVIDLLLMNVRTRGVQTRDDVFLMSDCVSSALKRYPFKGSQLSKVHWTHDTDFTVRGDQELMVYVLFNLFKNALYFIAKAMKGEIWIELSEDGKYSSLIFKDTGIGVSEEDLPNVFSRFFSKNTHHGTGLGLSFCKMVVEAHKGKIRCEAVEGEYTAFILSFPKK